MRRRESKGKDGKSYMVTDYAAEDGVMLSETRGLGYGEWPSH
jgi:hypothetical protein